jgi:SET family sugar efflux transporter-like MFS transporter
MMLTALAFALVALPLLLLGRTPLPHRAATPDTGDGRTATPDNADARAATPDTGDGRAATPDASDGRVTRAMLVAAASFTLFHTAMLAGSVALPLFVTRTLERSDGDVGLLFSVCALVEIPAALGLLLVPARVSRRGLILAGMVLFTAYFALVAIGSGMPLLIGTQVARGVALAVVGALGITYMQELLPQATGRATTMFANTLTIGSLVSGVLAGATAQAVGYRATLLLCGLLAAVGCVLFAAARPRPAGALTTPEVSPQPAGR